MNIYFRLTLFILTISTLSVKADRRENSCLSDAIGDKKLAKEYFDFGNYKCALEEYKILVAKKPKNVEYNYNLGVCYLRADEDKTKAIKYLEFVAQQDKYDSQVLFELANAYHHNKEFDKAIKYFEQFNEETKYKDSLYVNQYINYSLNAKEIIKYPLDVKIENLGDKINTPYKDYLPFIADDESDIYFTTKRRGTYGNIPDYDGEFVSDIFAAKTKLNDSWSRPKSASPLINTDLPEEMVAISRNGMHIIYNSDNFGLKDLSITTKPKETSRSFPKAEAISSINGSNSNECAATISDDGAFMIFASDREGGYGGYDLYMAKKLPNGNWGTPVNLGPNINTEFNDNYPNISADGKTLYFASQGHTSMGGYDIFKTTFNQWSNRWVKPKNVGYPVNTTMDDFNICFSKSGRYAYVAQIRPGGYGGYDIYRVTFFKKEPQLTVIRGRIVTDSTLSLVVDSLQKDVVKLQTKLTNRQQEISEEVSFEEDSFYVVLKENLETTNYRINLYDPVTLNDIKIIDKSNDVVYGRYKPNENTGKYVIILPAGEYELQIRNEGFEDYNEVIHVQDRNYYQAEIERDIFLKPRPEHIPEDF